MRRFLLVVLLIAGFVGRAEATELCFLSGHGCKGPWFSGPWVPYVYGNSNAGCAAGSTCSALSSGLAQAAPGANELRSSRPLSSSRLTHALAVFDAAQTACYFPFGASQTSFYGGGFNEYCYTPPPPPPPSPPSPPPSPPPPPNPAPPPFPPPPSPPLPPNPPSPPPTPFPPSPPSPPLPPPRPSPPAPPSPPPPSPSPPMPPMPPTPPAPPSPPPVLSTLLPGFACTTQDVTCAALGDLYSATNGSTWRHNSGWTQAAAGAFYSFFWLQREFDARAGIATDPCSFYSYGWYDGVGPPCDTNGILTNLCVLWCCVSNQVPRLFTRRAFITGISR